jgi:hypothetical protein
LLLQTFYHGLSTNICEMMDAVAGGAFLSLTLTQATNLVERMASPQERKRNAPTQRGRHAICQNGFTNEEA